jgi:putative ABC transport system substrate-binding protein
MRSEREGSMRRREFITTLGVAAATAAWPLAARAQQAAKALQVGFLYPGPQAGAVPRMAAYLSGLQAGGFRAEQFTLIPRVTGGNSTLLAPMAAELVASNVNLITAIGPAAVRTAQTATNVIPIVAIDLESDPVSSGFVASIARPGGNITGVFLDFPDFSTKWLEALKEGVPQLSNVAVLWDPATGPTQRNALDVAAKALGLSLTILEVRERADFATAFQSATQQRIGGAVILSSPLVGANNCLPNSPRSIVSRP